MPVLIHIYLVQWVAYGVILLAKAVRWEDFVLPKFVNEPWAHQAKGWNNCTPQSTQRSQREQNRMISQKVQFSVPCKNCLFASVLAPLCAL